MPSLEEFVDSVADSGLVEKVAWQRWRAQHEADCGASEQMADALVASGLITAWQRNLLLAGKTRGFFLGKYKILSQLGAGSMGAVYLAEHTLMRHRVAIKVMASRIQKSQRHIQRFQREARATAAVNHPRIVRAFDVEMSGDTPYLVMEYVEGDDLQKLVLEGGVLPVRDAAEVIRQAAEGLQAAHQSGLIHRDIKPSNILLDKQGEVHILDLGLARMEADEEASMTLMHNSKALGTVDYLAPEQARDSHAVDGRADIYSLGCTLYFLLTGEPPYNEGSIAQRILAHQTRPYPDVRQRRPEVPDDLVRILDKMLAKDRNHRFQSADRVAAALEEFLAGRPVIHLLSSVEEQALLRIDWDEAAESTHIATPATAASTPAAHAAVQSASVASKTGGVNSSSSAGMAASPKLPELPPLTAPDIFSSPSSDMQLGGPGLDPLQSLVGPTGLDTLSGQLDSTQPIPLLGLGPSAVAPTLAPSTATEQRSVRQTIVDAVARQAEEGEGIGGLKYKLWFLILFGALCGLILAGIGYTVNRTFLSTPDAPTRQSFEP